MRQSLFPTARGDIKGVICLKSLLFSGSRSMTNSTLLFGPSIDFTVTQIPGRRDRITHIEADKSGVINYARDDKTQNSSLSRGNNHSYSLVQ